MYIIPKTRNDQQKDDRCTKTMKMDITSKISLETEVMLIQLEVATRLTGSAVNREREREIERQKEN